MTESVSGAAADGGGAAGSAPSPAFHDPRTFVPHDFAEHSVDLGEVSMNYAMAGEASKPALLLIPGQTESWWGYEKAMPLLAEHFQVFAVDLRGQGRSTWTPGRYTLDNMGNDLVRFIATVIKRPVVTSGCSSGGLLSAWLSAFALPGQVRGTVWEDPPLFASETRPMVGQSIKQAIGPVFHLWATWLGDQWQRGDWEGMRKAAAAHDLPLLRGMPIAPEAPQNLKEYDPEWGRAFWEGTVMASLPHEKLLAQVKRPVLLTHHARFEPENRRLLGAMSDLQARSACAIMCGTGQPIEYLSLSDAAHAMHAADPKRFADVVIGWAGKLAA